ncbi:MAG: PKD domain-containing protein [Solirubrobacteraceae bacterium]
MGRTPAIRPAVLVVFTALWCALGAGVASASSVTIETHPPALTNQTDAFFTLIASPLGIGLTCQLDQNAPATCDLAPSYPSLGNGGHTFKVEPADDGSGTQSGASYQWTVDTDPPVTALDTSPPDSTTSTSATFTFHSEKLATFTCSLDGGAGAPCTSPQTYTGLPVGSHTFSVAATDQAGNVDPTPAGRQWTITAPIVGAPQIVTGALALSNNPSPVFTFSDTDPAVVSFQCQIDGGGYLPCASGAVFGPLGDGAHTFDVRGVTATSSTSAPASQTFTVDTTPPKTTIGRGPAGTTSSGDASFDLFSTENPATFTCQLDGGAPAPCGSHVAYLGLGSGQHVLLAKATDQAGNTDPTGDTWSWTIKGAPHPSFAVSNLNPLTGVPVTFTNTSTADPGYTVTGWAWDLGGDGSFSDGNGAVVARSFATPGNHTVRLKVVSQPGGGSGTAEVTLHVGDRPPVAGFRLSPRKPRARQDIDLISTATDSDTPIASQTWSVTGRGVRLDQAGDSATARFPRPGNYSVTLRVIDSLGAVSTITKRIKVLERPAPPWLVDVSGLPRVKGARFTKLRVRARQGDRVYVRCRGRRCRVRREFRKTVGPSANVYVRSYQTFFWAGSVLEVRIVDPDYLTKYVRIRVRGRNHGVSRFNGCIVPGRRPGRCP